jgi:hypothetical protein
VEDKATSQDATTNDEDDAEEECASKNIALAATGCNAPHYRHSFALNNKEYLTNGMKKINTLLSI